MLLELLSWFIFWLAIGLAVSIVVGQIIHWNDKE